MDLNVNRINYGFQGLNHSQVSGEHLNLLNNRNVSNQYTNTNHNNYTQDNRSHVQSSNLTNSFMNEMMFQNNYQIQDYADIGNYTQTSMKDVYNEEEYFIDTVLVKDLQTIMHQHSSVSPTISQKISGHEQTSCNKNTHGNATRNVIHQRSCPQNINMATNQDWSGNNTTIYSNDSVNHKKNTIQPIHAHQQRPIDVEKIFSCGSQLTNHFKPPKEAQSQLEPLQVTNQMNYLPHSGFIFDTSITPTSSISPNSDKQESKNDGKKGHISAEKRRRQHIKNSFDIFKSIIPSSYLKIHHKPSKALILRKGSEYMQFLEKERLSITEQNKMLRIELETLSNSIYNLQCALPAIGAPVKTKPHNGGFTLFQQYLHKKAGENWKFYIFTKILGKMLSSYYVNVKASNMDTLSTSSIDWIEHHCNLLELRATLSNELRKLSITTELLSNQPTSVSHEVQKMLLKERT